MGAEIDEASSKTFEDLRQVTPGGYEYWNARDLQFVLDYGSWQKFERVIEKAIGACNNSGYKQNHHFIQVDKMITVGKGGQRNIKDYALTRYACYLIVQNGDPSKPVIAKGQTYFAIQTRRKELEEQKDFQGLNEEQKRVMLRNEMKKHNKELAAAASDAGVVSPLDYAIFQDHGYKGLYGGLGAKDIHRHKGLKKSHKILDYMGSTELAANLFRATQTEEKLKRDKVSRKQEANKTHHEVGAKVRKTINELGGDMPEELPTPKKGIQQIERAQKKEGKKIGNK